MGTGAARIRRDRSWRDLETGDVFSVPGLRGRRFRFLGLVTNEANGDRYVEAMDVRDRRMRAFAPDRDVRKDRRASAEARRRRQAAAGEGPAPEPPPIVRQTGAYEPLRLFD